MLTNKLGNRESGLALILVVVVGVALLFFSAISVQMSLVHSVTHTVQREAHLARQIADSAAAQALAKIKEAGLLAPMSGGGASAQWVNFSEGQFYYHTDYDSATNVSTIRAWGRIPAGASPSACAEAPDSVSWDGTGWLVRGVEITVKGKRYIPEQPLYFGNGGIEKPLGGFQWADGVDPADPSTWQTVTSSPSSYQSSSVPFHSSALDHPFDYLYNGGAPAPASSPHPYKIWASQNPIGQFNISAWFTNSAGSGNDPTIGLDPPPTSDYYDTSDLNSPDHPYPVIPNLPDVQSFAFELWNRYKDQSSTTKLNSGSHQGTYGDLSNPGITFVTGALQVDTGTTFRGCGLLVIRDAYDPNTDTDNQPPTRARFDIRGTFQWTGLVIVAGWAPDISVSSDAGANATIAGALFGEDSVQSGGEISLDSATITMTIRNSFRILYSNGLFRQGGILHNYLPFVQKEVIGIREI
ncbi:MAG: hypothetical protein HY717_11705 [Planctomycetes bacterium]|nr:hypothetical protein [Planctomycetota bacterium]